jgi:hypothetical protein
MASSTSNVKVGVCKVSFNAIDLGYTKGGVEFDVETDTFVVTVDQFGNTPISEYINARKVTVKIPMAETTLENMVAIMPGATLVTDHVTATKKKVIVPTGVGTNLLDIAQQLILHPIGLADDDLSEDITVPLAATAGAVKFAYKIDDERVFEVTFTAYPADDGSMYIYGDPSATAV